MEGPGHNVCELADRKNNIYLDSNGLICHFNSSKIYIADRKHPTKPIAAFAGVNLKSDPLVFK